MIHLRLTARLFYEMSENDRRKILDCAAVSSVIQVPSFNDQRTASLHHNQQAHGSEDSPKGLPMFSFVIVWRLRRSARCSKLFLK